MSKLSKAQADKSFLQARVINNSGITTSLESGRFIEPFKVKNKKNNKLYTVLAVVFSATNNDHQYHVLYLCNESNTLYLREEFEFNKKFKLV